MVKCSKVLTASLYIVDADILWAKAAKMAGLHPVSLIKEPEAAALYTLQSLKFSLEEGNVFVICDAGGGTVDLISYQVEAVSPRLQLKELVSGKG